MQEENQKKNNSLKKGLLIVLVLLLAVSSTLVYLWFSNEPRYIFSKDFHEAFRLLGDTFVTMDSGDAWQEYSITGELCSYEVSDGKLAVSICDYFATDANIVNNSKVELNFPTEDLQVTGVANSVSQLSSAHEAKIADGRKYLTKLTYKASLDWDKCSLIDRVILESGRIFNKSIDITSCSQLTLDVDFFYESEIKGQCLDLFSKENVLDTVEKISSKWVERIPDMNMLDHYSTYVCMPCSNSECANTDRLPWAWSVSNLFYIDKFMSISGRNTYFEPYFDNFFNQQEVLYDSYESYLNPTEDIRLNWQSASDIYPMCVPFYIGRTNDMIPQNFTEFAKYVCSGLMTESVNNMPEDQIMTDDVFYNYASAILFSETYEGNDEILGIVFSSDNVSSDMVDLYITGYSFDSQHAINMGNLMGISVMKHLKSTCPNNDGTSFYFAGSRSFRDLVYALKVKSIEDVSNREQWEKLLNGVLTMCPSLDFSSIFASAGLTTFVTREPTIGSEYNGYLYLLWKVNPYDIVRFQLLDKNWFDALIGKDSELLLEEIIFNNYYSEQCGKADAYSFITYAGNSDCAEYVSSAKIDVLNAVYLILKGYVSE